MLRSALVSLCGLLLRIFFRRIEIVGAHHLPESGAIVLTANHQNGLIDPLLLLCLVPRRVSFLAKEPLFRTPIVGIFVRAFESLPVYRAVDGADPSKNKRMIQGAVELLGRGNVLGLFPEGTSHSDPELRPFKSGAARIALSARAASRKPVSLVPLFLYYEDKSVFRSRAVLAYGPPLEVPDVELDENGEPPRDVARALTERLRETISHIAPTATTVDAIVLAEAAERILEATDEDVGPEGPESGPSLADRMKERRRLLDAYPLLRAKDPARVDALTTRLEELRAAFARAGLPIDVEDDLGASSSRWLAQLGLAIALFVPGIVGVALHLPTYQAVHFIATRYSGRERDVLATMKLVAGFLLFPLTWTFFGFLGVSFWGLAGFFAGFFGGLASAFVALQLRETLDWLERRFDYRADRRDHEFTRLREERRVLAAEIRSLLS